MRVRFQSQAVSSEVLRQLVIPILDSVTPSGYTSIDNTLEMTSLTQPTVAQDGSIHWTVSAKRDLQVNILASQANEIVTGVTVAEAKEILSSALPLKEHAQIELIPHWWPQTALPGFAHSGHAGKYSMRILAVDPGEKRIGIAISDPTSTIASPLTVIKHVSRLVDAATIAELAKDNQAEMIIVGTSLDDDGLPTSASRRADRLAEAIRQQNSLPVQMWDESFSTQAARQARIEMRTTRQKRRGHLDELAATVMLQSFLDSELNK